MDLVIQRNPPDHSAERRADGSASGVSTNFKIPLVFFSSLSFLQFENLASILKLPGKKTFNNMDRDFLEKRKKDLNAYLQVSEAPARLQRDTQVPLGIVLVFFSHLLNNACVCVLQLLLNPEMVKACPTLISYVYDFLENKAYSKGKGEFARKVLFFSLRTHHNHPRVSFCSRPAPHPPVSLPPLPPDRSTPSSTPCAAP